MTSAGPRAPQKAGATFDEISEGISYVRNYRTDLDSEIAAKGLNAVIARIEKQGLSPATTRAAGP